MRTLENAAPATGSAAAAIRTLETEPGASLKTWIGVGGAILGAFMAVLNIQITGASLADIEGGIGAGSDEGAWIITAYLVGEIIVIPLADYLSRVFSMRRFLIAHTVLFLAFSVACAFARSLPEMIVLRALQGFFGGVLIPLAFTIVVSRLPKRQQPAGLALFSLTAVSAPAFGPVIGGWLTETYGWPYVFFMNLVPGVFMLAALAHAIEREPMRLDLLKQGDWPGIATLAIGLGAFQTMMEEGNRNDWFGSPFIIRLALVAALACILFVIIELRSDRPVVQLRLLVRHRNLGLGILASAGLGFALYGSVYLIPVYLDQTQGYNPRQIGGVLTWTGLPQLFLIPFVPLLLRRIDIRLLGAVGFVLFGVSCWMNSWTSPDFSGPQMLSANLVRALGQALVMTPLNLLVVAGIAPAQAGAASGLYNMARNLAGAAGTALLETIVTRREQLHSARIGAHLTDGSAAGRLDALRRYFMARGVSDPALAWHEAAVALGRNIHRQALIMGFSDAFMLMAGVLAVSAMLVLTLQPPRPAGSGSAGH